MVTEREAYEMDKDRIKHFIYTMPEYWYAFGIIVFFSVVFILTDYI